MSELPVHPTSSGAPLNAWQPRPRPPHQPLQGRFVRLEPLQLARHGEDLWQALQGPDPALWDYMAYGPFASRAAFDAWLAGQTAGRDPQFYAVIGQADGRALGLLAYLNIAPEHGSLEIGHVLFGAALQRTPGASEAIYLLARQAFDALGYRRLEWKCDAHNARSLRAALRLGFVQEGLLRQHRVVKGRNRDTAWLALLDGAWPACRAALERWLAADNFTPDGTQRQRLEALRG